MRDTKTFVDFHRKYGRKEPTMEPRIMKKLFRELLINVLKEYRWKYETGTLGADDVLTEVFQLLDEYDEYEGWKEAHNEEKRNRLCR